MPTSEQQGLQERQTTVVNCGNVTDDYICTSGFTPEQVSDWNRLHPAVRRHPRMT